MPPVLHSRPPDACAYDEAAAPPRLWPHLAHVTHCAPPHLHHLPHIPLAHACLLRAGPSSRIMHAMVTHLLLCGRVPGSAHGPPACLVRARWHGIACRTSRLLIGACCVWSRRRAPRMAVNGVASLPRTRTLTHGAIGVLKARSTALHHLLGIASVCALLRRVTPLPCFVHAMTMYLLPCGPPGSRLHRGGGARAMAPHHSAHVILACACLLPCGAVVTFCAFEGGSSPAAESAHGSRRHRHTGSVYALDGTTSLVTLHTCG